MTNPMRFFCFFVCILSMNLAARGTDYQTSWVKIKLDEKGWIQSLSDETNHKEYLPEGQAAPLLSIRCRGEFEAPSRAAIKRNTITLWFEQNQVEAQIKAEENEGYISFELMEISPFEKVELVIWGPYPTTIGRTIGECVGVVRNEEYALGIQALNVKTMGGYPTNENDTEPSYNIFATNNLVDIDESVRILYRGQTAKHTETGSVLQAYCRNRNEKRVIPNWGHTHYVVPPYDDGGVTGSKIALFGCPPDKALDVIGQIERTEGLPHPAIDGEWAKTARRATESYLIMGFNEENLDEALQLTQKAGLATLYQGGAFETWGHFKLHEEGFPDNWESMKRCVERAKDQGIKLGVHTLSNFITTNDTYVTPTPDPRLAKVGKSALTRSIDAEDQEIYIQSPRYFNQMENNTLHAVVVGNEIIRYETVSDEEPWRLVNCIRGAFNTEATAHKEGAEIGKLMDHGYKVFLSNTDLSLEIAQTIASLFNETGLRQVSFDGLEGTWSTGMGQYARSLFTKEWYDHLKPELRRRVINDASNPSHFNWHINTRYNWGEPWYAGFRESQTQYRLMNQDFYRRNLLPAMLGWFSMSDQTSIEDAEWLLARAAGFDAGFAFNVSLNAVEHNGQSDAIFEAIKQWETARMAGAFSKEQKKLMENIENEFHLEATAPGEWKLFPWQIERFAHVQRIRQPGEPVHSTFEFNNPYEEQPLQFIIRLNPGENNNDSPVDGITIELNNFHKIEIPVKMLPTQILKLDQKGEIQLFDKNWNKIETIPLKSHIPRWSQGKNKVTVDAKFSTGTGSRLDIEFKSLGKGEIIIVPAAD